MRLVSLRQWNRSNNSLFQIRLYQHSALLPKLSEPFYDRRTLGPPVDFDPGMRALKQEIQGRDPLKFLAGAQVSPLTPALGDEIDGVDLTKLDLDSKDQLALQVARRGVLVFRNQEAFINKDKEWLTNWGAYFGRAHILPVRSHSKHYHGKTIFDLVDYIPEMLRMHLRPPADREENHIVPHKRISSHSWYSDGSFELQPPGVTAFFLLSQPETGRDTIFSSTVTALKRLSPQFVEFLKSLKALHSSTDTVAFIPSGKKSGIVKREPVENEHPVVRRHPVTGDEALFVNERMTTRIVGLMAEESYLILKFLYDHIAKGDDFQARVKWRPNTVVMWDNRVTNHTAVIETDEPVHGSRITAQAERPIPASYTSVQEWS